MQIGVLGLLVLLLDIYVLSLCAMRKPVPQWVFHILQNPLTRAVLLAILYILAQINIFIGLLGLVFYIIVDVDIHIVQKNIKVT